MRARVPASTLKRLESLEKRKGQGKPVMMLPHLIYDADDWSAIAEPMQQRLKENVKHDDAVNYSDLPMLELVASR